MRPFIFACLFLMNSFSAQAEVDRQEYLASAGYKDAVKVTKISDSGEQKSAFVTLSHGGELRMVQDIEDAVYDNRQYETLIGARISEMAIVGDRLVVVDFDSQISFVEPKPYSAAHFALDTLSVSGGVALFVPWNYLAAQAVALCSTSAGLPTFILAGCAQVAVAGRLYINKAKQVAPRAAKLSPAVRISTGGLVSNSVELVRSKDGKIEDLLLDLEGDKIRLTELREIEQTCDKILVPITTYRYETFNP